MKYAKAWVAALSVVAAALTTAFTDNVVDINEVAEIVSTLVVSGLGVYAVYKVPNAKE